MTIDVVVLVVVFLIFLATVAIGVGYWRRPK